MNTKYYITGNQGFIASHLLKRIEADGHDLKSGRNSNMLQNIDEKYDVVFHLAAHLTPTDDKDIILHRNVLEYCKRTGAYLVYASSAAVYNPDSLYAIQKLYGEILFKDIPHTTLRFFNVYGEGGHGVVDKIKRGELKIVNGNGDQTRDYIDVYDVVQALLVAGEQKIQGTFDIGTGESHSVNDLLRYADYEDYVCMHGDIGVIDSIAKPSIKFPWVHERWVEKYIPGYEKA